MLDVSSFTIPHTTNLRNYLFVHFRSFDAENPEFEVYGGNDERAVDSSSFGFRQSFPMVPIKNSFAFLSCTGFPVVLDETVPDA